MTPAYRTPAHVTSDGQQHSNVFHRAKPGRIIAVFYGENHVADSEEYCKWNQENVEGREVSLAEYTRRHKDK